jgi:hypothetical protein
MIYGKFGQVLPKEVSEVGSLGFLKRWNINLFVVDLLPENVTHLRMAICVNVNSFSP